MKITEVLSAEHTIFLRVFDQIEKALPGVTTLNEVRTFGSVVEGLLEGHAETERNMAYIALDHVLADKDSLDRLHHEHDEIDDGLKRVFAATDCARACSCLRAALDASRKHFRYEEKHIFPLLEFSLRGETLEKLGKSWHQQQADASARP
jgi:hemerythrin-like domain-containing protein